MKEKKKTDLEHPLAGWGESSLRTNVPLFKEKLLL